jgi:D-amino-acid oxidase
VSEEEKGGTLARADAVVVGCGVIGLTAAICLREAGLDAGIVAAMLPHDTTSSVAAAIWYPYKAYPEDNVLSWGSRTFEIFEELSGTPESGVLMREGVEIWRQPVPDPWWSGAVPQIRRCNDDELPPGYRDGHAFVAPVVEMPIYLEYLLDRFSAAGGSVQRRTLSSLEEVDARVVVNCVGLGARDLVDDASMEPIRGQIVRMRNPGLKRFVLDEENPEGVAYIVPRSGDCILGGTAEEGELLEHKVGLRPGRPEIRLEREDGVIPRIHNYGHGGSGITLSWGCAEQTLRLVQEALGD